MQIDCLATIYLSSKAIETLCPLQDIPVNDNGRIQKSPSTMCPRRILTASKSQWPFILMSMKNYYGGIVI